MSCPFDCLSCDQRGNCLTCSYLDKRTINRTKSNNVRCSPIEGYYESRQRKSARCPEECRTCQSKDKCTSCIKSYELNRGSCKLAAKDCTRLNIALSILVILMALYLIYLKGKALCNREGQILDDKKRKPLHE